MANFTKNLKTAWFKCVETVGQGAANLADSAKQKLSEINMESRRKDIVAALPSKLMELWKNGVSLPEELNTMLTELNGLEEELAAAKAARQAKKAKPALTDGSDAEAAPAQESSEAAAEEPSKESVEPEAACAEESSSTEG